MNSVAIPSASDLRGRIGRMIARCASNLPREANTERRGAYTSARRLAKSSEKALVAGDLAKANDLMTQAWAIMPKSA